MIRIEVTNEADVTRMVAAFTTLPVLRDSDYEVFLGDGLNGGVMMRRAWRKDGQRSATNPTDWGTCHAAGTWEGGPVRCVHPPGHKAFLDHFDRDRGLRWTQADSGEISAWPDTENETWAIGGRRYRREMLEYTDRNRGLLSPAARRELEEMRAEDQGGKADAND